MTLDELKELKFDVVSAAVVLGKSKDALYPAVKESNNIALDFYYKNPNLFTMDFREILIDKVDEIGRTGRFITKKQLFDAAVVATKEVLQIGMTNKIRYALKEAYYQVTDAIDVMKWRCWKSLPNGCAELQSAYMAVDDTKDCLDAIAACIQDGDCEEALRLINISRDSIKDHIDTLRGLL